MKNKFIKGVAIILVNKRNELLLHLRDNKTTIPHPGYWSLISGHVQKNENSLNAIKRELKEEIDYKIINIKKLGIISGKKFKIVIYIGKINKHIKNINLYEGQRIKYFKIDKIKNLHTPYFLKKFIFSNKNKILNFNKN